MLSCLDSLTSSPYSLFSSVVSNPPRVSHRGVLGLPVWPCFAQALDLEELSARQDRVSRRTSQRICRANGLWGSEAVAEILPWGSEHKPKLLVGSCKFFISVKGLEYTFSSSHGGLQKTFILSNLVKLVQRQTGGRGQKWWESANHQEVFVLPGSPLRGAACIYTKMFSWSGSTSLACRGGQIQGFPSGRSAGDFSHPGPHFTRVTFFCLW